MAGDGVIYAWNDTEVQQQLARMIGNITDMTPVMKGFSEYMVMRTDERFRDEKAPDGSRWQELADVTKAKKQAEGKIDKILQQDGYLRLVHPSADKDSGGIYSDRKYSAIHNRGGKAGRGLKVTIPKREFMGFDDEDIREFQATVADFVIGIGGRS